MTGRSSVSFMTKLSLHTSLCGGFGLDGASPMMGKLKGCALVISKKYPFAKVSIVLTFSLNSSLLTPVAYKKIVFDLMIEVHEYIHLLVEHKHPKLWKICSKF